MKLIANLFLLYFIAVPQANAINLKQIYIDKKHRVHVLTSREKDLRVSTTGRANSAKLSPDGKTAAWLISSEKITEEIVEPNFSELVIYSNGRTRTIKCEPFIREYWYWMQGRNIAIDCGSLHFAGREILYDIKSLKEIDSFDQATVSVEKRPTWSVSRDQDDTK